MTDFILVLPILLFSVVAHEYAHAWTAFRQGDPGWMCAFPYASPANWGSWEMFPFVPVGSPIPE